jgi:hypothetical protein
MEIKLKSPFKISKNTQNHSRNKILVQLVAQNCCFLNKNVLKFKQNGSFSKRLNIIKMYKN